MRSLALRLAFAVTLVALCLVARAADACSCLGTISGHQPCQDRWTSAAVFAGRVVAIDPASRQVVIPEIGRNYAVAEWRVRFAVSEAFSGVSTHEVDVSTGQGGGDCGFTFEVGREYLVYADKRADGSLDTGICSPTKSLDAAKADLAYLRAVPAVPGRAGRLIGLVVRSEPGMDWPTEPRFPGVRVIAEGEGLARSATSGPDGKYEIQVPPGHYQLRAVAPDGMYATVFSDFRNRDVELKDARGCAVADVTVSYDGHIKTRVVTTSGDAVPFLPFALKPADPKTPYRTVEGRTGADGRIDLGHVPAGRFFLVTPSALGAVTSEAVEVAPGATVTAGNVVVPDSLRFVTVTGVVLDPLGHAADGASVYLEPDIKDLRLIGPSVKADAEGRFSLAAIAGTHYKIVAERFNPPRGLAQAEVQIQATPGADPLVLRLVVK